jgi:hypothetical protein
VCLARDSGTTAGTWTRARTRTHTHTHIRRKRQSSTGTQASKRAHLVLEHVEVVLHVTRVCIQLHASRLTPKVRHQQSPVPVHPSRVPPVRHANRQAHHLRTNGLFSEFSLCLSRACLGKMFVYINGSKRPFLLTVKCSRGVFTHEDRSSQGVSGGAQRGYSEKATFGFGGLVVPVGLGSWKSGLRSTPSTSGGGARPASAAIVGYLIGHHQSLISLLAAMMWLRN